LEGFRGFRSLKGFKRFMGGPSLQPFKLVEPSKRFKVHFHRVVGELAFPDLF